MSIDTVMQDLLRDARVLRKWDARNEPLAARMEARASYLNKLKDRKPVVTGKDASFPLPLDNEDAAWALAWRIIGKIDPEDWGYADAHQIGEPGYNPNIGVFANWNKYPKWLAAVEKLERLGCPISAEWSDEWIECDNCNRAFRSQPDSYGWTRSYWASDDGCYCQDCVREYMLDEYLEWLTESHERADLFLSDGELEDAGWRRVDEKFENGLYGGQSSEPKKIAAYLHRHGFDRLLFKVDSVGQFDMDFSVWVPVTDDDVVLTAEDADRALRQAYWSDLNGPDPAVMMQRALKSIPPMRNDGTIQYSKVNVGTGTVETRYLTPEEFVEGVTP